MGQGQSQMWGPQPNPKHFNKSHYLSFTHTNVKFQNRFDFNCFTIYVFYTSD